MSASAESPPDQPIEESLQPASGSSNRLSLYRKSINNLPLPPALWQAFQQACARDASSQQLGAIIRDDPVLAATVLRTANSPIFGLRTTINDIGRAISHLGVSLVRSMVARHSFASALQGQGKIYNTHKLWRHGMAVAALAEIVAGHIPGCKAEEAATLGLFHDVGRMAFNLLTEYALPATPEPEQGHLQYELRRFGCTHVEMSVMLGQHWQLPEAIVQGIAHHHHPAFAGREAIPEAIQREVAAVYFADLLAIQAGFDGDQHAISTPHADWAELLPASTRQAILQDAHTDAELKRIEAVEF